MTARAIPAPPETAPDRREVYEVERTGHALLLFSPAPPGGASADLMRQPQIEEPSDVRARPRAHRLRGIRPRPRAARGLPRRRGPRLLRARERTVDRRRGTRVGRRVRR